MGMDADQSALLRQALDQNDAPGRWRRVLETLLPTGVADMTQIELATHLSRDQLKGLVIKFGKVTGGGPPLLYRVEVKVPRPGQRGRVPTIYRLGEAGAGVMHAVGCPDARPCGLTSAVSISHALAMLDVHLAARQAGLAVVTDRELANGRGQLLRPDNVITLADGSQALFETEQAARAAQLERIVESIRNKAGFFRAAAPERRISPAVGVLFALPRGRDLERTWQVWERAVAAVADARDGALPFRLLALPLDEFLARPDWGEPPDAGRWRNLLNPALLAGFTPAPVVLDPEPGTGGGALVPAGKPALLPAPLARYSAVESRLVLAAMWQVFRESASAELAAGPRPDPAFFELMTMIYLAGHQPQAPVLVRAGLPRASWWFLYEYLRIHLPLRDALDAELTRGGGMTWNASTIKHRMQKTVDTFLAYHGFRSDGPLFACADGAEWNSQTTRQFFVRVAIRVPELLLGDGDGLMPAPQEVQLAEQALAWVLWTLFANGEQVGLKRPPYW